MPRIISEKKKAESSDGKQGADEVPKAEILHCHPVPSLVLYE